MWLCPCAPCARTGALTCEREATLALWKWSKLDGENIESNWITKLQKKKINIAKIHLLPTEPPESVLREVAMVCPESCQEYFLPSGPWCFQAVPAEMQWRLQDEQNVKKLTRLVRVFWQSWQQLVSINFFISHSVDAAEDWDTSMYTFDTCQGRAWTWMPMESGCLGKRE